ncbi:MAG: hypothetical protein ACR2OL_02345 [Anderseniella sp.]
MVKKKMLVHILESECKREVGPANLRDEAVKTFAKKAACFILDDFNDNGEGALLYFRGLIGGEFVDASHRLFLEEIERCLVAFARTGRLAAESVHPPSGRLH